MLDKKSRDELKKFKLELKKAELQKKYLLKKDADFGLLEDLVAKSNQNPNLEITVSLGDGTKIVLKTTNSNRKANPLFTDEIYNDFSMSNI